MVKASDFKEFYRLNINSKLLNGFPLDIKKKILWKEFNGLI